MSRELQLAAGVYFCTAQGHGVFLDLKRDTYNAVPLAERGGNSSAPSLSAQLEPHADVLIEAGLLLEEPGWLSPLEAFRKIRAPIEQLFGSNDERAFGMTRDRFAECAPTFVEWVAMFLACGRATRDLREKPIDAVVSDVRRRRCAISHASRDLDAVRRSVAVFRRMRPWYPRGYVCLADSLALMNFLLGRGFSSSWIFGVQALPFGAHCWIQIDGVLLNDGVEYVRQFTPIMCV